MQVSASSLVSLELVEKAVAGARWTGAQQATAEDAGQDMALAILMGKKVEHPRLYGKWMALNATNVKRQKRNSEVMFSDVFNAFAEEEDLPEDDSVVDQSIWFDVEAVCTVFEFRCLRGRFVSNLTLEELAEENGVGLHVVARAIKRALLKLKEVMA